MSLEMSVSCVRGKKMQLWWSHMGVWRVWSVCCSGEKSAEQKRHKKKGELQNQRILVLAAIL